jgi:hypothetical protein
MPIIVGVQRRGVLKETDTTGRSPDQGQDAVVMQDGKVVAVSEGRDEEVDRWQSVVADPRELASSIERAPLHVLIYVEAGKREEQRVQRRGHLGPRSPQAVPRRSCRGEASSSRTGPAGAANLIGGSAVRRDVSPPDPLGKLPPSSRRAFALSPKLRGLFARAKDHQLAELDPRIAELASQLVERGLDGSRLGNGVAAMLRRHEAVVTRVSHHTGSCAAVGKDSRPETSPFS